MRFYFGLLIAVLYTSSLSAKSCWQLKRDVLKALRQGKDHKYIAEDVASLSKWCKTQLQELLEEAKKIGKGNTLRSAAVYADRTGSGNSAVLQNTIGILSEGSCQGVSPGKGNGIDHGCSINGPKPWMATASSLDIQAVAFDTPSFVTFDAVDDDLGATIAAPFDLSATKSTAVNPSYATTTGN